MHQQRKTPISCGNTPGTNRKPSPKHPAGETYTTDSYRRAIARSCNWAFPPLKPLAKRDEETNAPWQKRLTKQEKAELAAWRKAHCWHPHQLRHNVATEPRKEFSLEAACIILGHRSPAITKVYTEKDKQNAKDAIAKVG